MKKDIHICPNCQGIMKESINSKYSLYEKNKFFYCEDCGVSEIVKGTSEYFSQSILQK